MKTLRIGTIGAGWVAQDCHMRSYREVADVELVAACDTNPKTRKRTEERWGIRTYKDWADMLAAEKLDAVSVCTPNSFHALAAVDAMRAGCHVLCEKPMCITGREADRMVETAKATKRVLMVAFNQRFNSDSQLLKSMIEKGDLGDIYYAKTQWLRRRGIPGAGGWFTTKKLSGGGPLIDLGVHMLDLTMWMMGNPKPVTVSGAAFSEFRRLVPKKSGTFDVEDMAAGFVRFANGASLTIEASWASNVKKEIVSTQLFGDKGGVLMGHNLDSGKSLEIFAERDGALVDIAPMPGRNVDSYVAEVSHFIECIRKRKTPLATGQHGRYVTKIIEGLYKSSDRGREVKLDL